MTLRKCKEENGVPKWTCEEFSHAKKMGRRNFSTKSVEVKTERVTFNTHANCTYTNPAKKIAIIIIENRKD